MAAQLCGDRIAEIMNAPASDVGTVRNAPLDGDDAREAACRLAVLNALRGDEGDEPSLWAAEAGWLEARLGLPEDHVLEEAQLGAAALDALTDTQLAMLGKVDPGRLAAIIATVRDHAGPADGRPELPRWDLVATREGFPELMAGQFPDARGGVAPEALGRKSAVPTQSTLPVPSASGLVETVALPAESGSETAGWAASADGRWLHIQVRVACPAALPDGVFTLVEKDALPLAEVECQLGSDEDGDLLRADLPIDPAALSTGGLHVRVAAPAGRGRAGVHSAEPGAAAQRRGDTGGAGRGRKTLLGCGLGRVADAGRTVGAGGRILGRGGAAVEETHATGRG